MMMASLAENWFLLVGGGGGGGKVHEWRIKREEEKGAPVNAGALFSTEGHYI